MREFIAAGAVWLTVFQLPTYAPDLNPQDGIWSLVKRESATLPQPTWARSPGREGQAQADPIPPGLRRQLPCGHRPHHGRLSGAALQNRQSP
ncbi:hypothetical protein ACKI19_25380 [Streptomyces caniscabiei]|uniref:hypothetical protein n=1 Tax=Streptomyces caniscabiei TaxID=2746961 RepID=UPI000AB78003|nr:hypothetical protein [Streptomyces sp. FxanaA7]